jgi:cytochrome c biogenesis protein CcdA
VTATAKLFSALLLICAGAFPPEASTDIVFSPPTWKFGTVFQGEKIQSVVTLKNTGKIDITVGLLPTCTCMTVTPAQRLIRAGADGTFVISYDSSDDTGITRKDFIVRAVPPSAVPMYYTITGVVRAERRAGTLDGSPPASSNARPAGQTVTITYYYTPGCRSCNQFLSTEIPRLSHELGISIPVNRRDVLQPALYEELASFAASRGQTVREIPALAVGNVLLQGDTNIRKDLEAVLRTLLGGQPAPVSSAPRFPASAVFFPERLAALPIAAAGLIDGVNPCAFTTLIFLLASLALAGRGRREVLLIGALFTMAVFLTYLGIGYGLFAVLRAASAVSIVSLVLRWALAAVLTVFAGLSVYDYALIRQGRPTRILLQLPAALKRQIHASIRTRVRSAALAGSSIVLGFLVSIFEFACTGQVYLPMLAYLVRMRGGITALALLLLYNLCFIVPLLIVFGASYLGVTSGRITTLFQAHIGKVKLSLAGVFVALAVFTLVG